MTDGQIMSLRGMLYGLSDLWTGLRFLAEDGGDNWVLSYNNPLDHPTWVRVGTFSPARSERARRFPAYFRTSFPKHVVSYHTIAQLERKRIPPVELVPLADKAIAAKMADPTTWRTSPVLVDGKPLDFQVHVDGEYLSGYSTLLPSWLYIQARNVSIDEIALVSVDDLTPYVEGLAQLQHDGS